MNHTSTLQQKGTASAGNDSTLGEVPGALTGKGKIPPSECPQLGQTGGNPQQQLSFGHLMRRTDSLEKTLKLGKIEAGVAA